MPDSGIRNEEQYEALIKKGYSKEKSARIPIHPILGKGEEKQNHTKNGQRKNS